jgi:hypothetical protein
VVGDGDMEHLMMAAVVLQAAVVAVVQQLHIGEHGCTELDVKCGTIKHV